MADEPLTFVPPSQQSAQGPVPKPGEPILPEKGVMSPKHKSEDQRIVPKAEAKPKLEPNPAPKVTELTPKNPRGPKPAR